MARQIRLPYQEAPPGALEERVHVLEARLALLTRVVRVLATERAAGREPDSVWRELEALIAAGVDGVPYDDDAREVRP
jgi:hypothetical protein